MSTKQFNYENRLLVFDLSNIIFRSYFSQNNYDLVNNKGCRVNLIFNSLNRISQIYRLFPSKYVLIACDSGTNFRKEKYLSTYKTNRKPKEKEMLQQIPILKVILRANGFMLWEQDNFEADDIIASTVKDLHLKNIASIIISSDKDLMQLVDDKKNISFFNLHNNTLYKEQQVKEHFDVPANLLNDYLCLLGDSCDNIEGIKGWGKKTSAKYLNKFGGLKNLYEFCKNLTKEQASIKDYKKFIILKNNLSVLKRNKILVSLVDNLIYEKSFVLNKPYLKILEKIEQKFQLNFKVLINNVS